jgi:hypothetical protein
MTERQHDPPAEIHLTVGHRLFCLKFQPEHRYTKLAFRDSSQMFMFLPCHDLQAKSKELQTKPISSGRTSGDAQSVSSHSLSTTISAPKINDIQSRRPGMELASRPSAITINRRRRAGLNGFCTNYICGKNIKRY